MRIALIFFFTQYCNFFYSDNKKHETTNTCIVWLHQKRLHRGEEVTIDIPMYVNVEEGSLTCPECPKRFKNTQGLSVHLKCVRSTGLEKNQSSLRLISFEHTKETNMQQDVGLVLDSIVKKVEGNILKYGAAKKNMQEKREKLSRQSSKQKL